MKLVNKLVRDKIPKIIKTAKKVPITRIADEEEFKILLRKKLVEEANELLNKVSAEEIADILEVVYTIIKAEGFDKNTIEKLRSNKLKERGSFEKRIVLEGVEE